MPPAEAITRVIRRTEDATARLDNLNRATREAIENLRRLGYTEEEVSRARFVPRPDGGGVTAVIPPVPRTQPSVTPPSEQAAPADGGGVVRPPQPPADDAIPAWRRPGPEKFGPNWDRRPPATPADGGADNAMPPQRPAPAGEPLPRTGQPGAGQVDSPDSPQREERTLAEQRRRGSAVSALSVLSERELRAEWRANQVELRQQHRELDRTIERQEKLRRSLEDVTDAERRGRVHRDLGRADERRRDLEQGAQMLRDREAALRTEAERRGMSPSGDILMAGGRGGGTSWQSLAGAALGGAGIGGGSMMGTLAGAALGSLTWPRALALLAGMTVGRGLSMGNEAYGARVAALGSAIPTSTQLGVGTDEQIQWSASEAQRLGLYRPQELLGHLRQLARTGRIDAMPNLGAVALSTGRDLSEVVGTQASLAPLGKGVHPDLLPSLLAAYARSGVARAAPTPLGMSTGLLPQFEAAIEQLAQSMAGPFSRPSVEGLAGQLAAMSQLNVPGVEPGTPGALDVARGRLQSWQGFTGGMVQQGGPLGDVAYYAVRELRRDPRLVKLLQDKEGIDITSPVGVLRAARRAPGLAASGIPEVAEAMHAALQRFVPDRGLRELMMYNATGDPEAAAFLSDPSITGQVLGGAALGQDPRAAGLVQSAATQARRRTAVDEVAARVVTPEIPPLTAPAAQDVGRMTQELKNTMQQVGYEAMQQFGLGWGALSDRVITTLESLLGAEVRRQATP